MIIVYLTIAILAVFAGAITAFVSGRNANPYPIIFGFTVGAVLGILLILVFHLYSEFGFSPLLVMAGGFLLIFAVERMAHQDSHSVERPWGANLTLIGLSIHALTDGLNLVIASQDGHFGPGLAIAILAHRFPVATALTLAFSKTRSHLAALMRISPLAIAPVIGVFIGERFLTGVVAEFAAYLTAFAGGTLLHVLFHGATAHISQSRTQKLVGGVAFTAGVLAVFLVTQNAQFRLGR